MYIDILISKCSMRTTEMKGGGAKVWPPPSSELLGTVFARIGNLVLLLTFPGLEYSAHGIDVHGYRESARRYDRIG